MPVKYFANPCTEAARDQMSAGRIGCIVTPDQGNCTFALDGWDVIADNGCFSRRWDERRWLAWLLDLPRALRFAVVPDVFDPTGAPCHDATVERWRRYGPLVERHGFTPAFVCQVGSTPETIPADAPALFLGGTTSWKLGPVAAAIAARHGDRWIHMGRDRNLPELLSWVDDQRIRPQLWEAVMGERRSTIPPGDAR